MRRFITGSVTHPEVFSAIELMSDPEVFTERVQRVIAQLPTERRRRRAVPPPPSDDDSDYNPDEDD